MIALFLGAAFAASPGVFEGTWVHSGGAAEKTAIEAVVESGAARFNFAIRPIARRALTKACALDETIVITGDESTITMDYAGGNPRVSGGPSDGSPTKIRGSDVTFVLSGTKLVVDGTSSDGGKAATYVVNGDTMKATYSVRSEKLGDPPLTWTLSFKRAP